MTDANNKSINPMIKSGDNLVDKSLEEALHHIDKLKEDMNHLCKDIDSLYNIKNSSSSPAAHENHDDDDHHHLTNGDLYDYYYLGNDKEDEYEDGQAEETDRFRRIRSLITANQIEKDKFMNESMRDLKKFNFDDSLLEKLEQSKQQTQTQKPCSCVYSTANLNFLSKNKNNNENDDEEEEKTTNANGLFCNNSFCTNSIINANIVHETKINNNNEEFKKSQFPSPKIIANSQLANLKRRTNLMMMTTTSLIGNGGSIISSNRVSRSSKLLNGAASGGINGGGCRMHKKSTSLYCNLSKRNKF
jgi:hypothetical protein